MSFPPVTTPAPSSSTPSKVQPEEEFNSLPQLQSLIYEKNEDAWGESFRLSTLAAAFLVEKSKAASLAEKIASATLAAKYTRAASLRRDEYLATRDKVAFAAARVDAFQFTADGCPTVDAKTLMQDDSVRWRLKDMSLDNPIYELKVQLRPESPQVQFSQSAPNAAPPGTASLSLSFLSDIDCIRLPRARVASLSTSHARQGAPQPSPAGSSSLSAVSKRMPFPILPATSNSGEAPAAASAAPSISFKTGLEKYFEDCDREGRKPAIGEPKRKSLGGKRKFISPVRKDEKEEEPANKRPLRNDPASSSARPPCLAEEEEKMRFLSNPHIASSGLELELIERIYYQVLDRSPEITWDDIAGLRQAKRLVQEIAVLPLQRPELFTGLRAPPRGLLLFGPPGTGKTMIGKAIASICKYTFFSVSASSLTSKWVGEGEKMVKALFTVARVLQPSVIFVDEIDSLLTTRSEGEFEASRRIKTEFLLQWDGVGNTTEEKVLLIGATNRPQELDSAALRRMPKRLYIPLPDAEGRHQLITRLLAKEQHVITDQEIEELVKRSEGYSGSDLTNLCKEAAMGPLRDIEDLMEADALKVRPVRFADFLEAFDTVRPVVTNDDLRMFEKWNDMYGVKYKRDDRPKNG